MIRRSKSITAEGRRFGVVLEQAEDGCLAYLEVTNLDTFAPDTQPVFTSEP